MFFSRRAFTLLELLVVIAVIGILISLLLPAVSQTREAARRVQCRNNLRQLALAVTNYENTNKRYPPAGLVGDPVSYDLNMGPFDPHSGRMISWMVLVLAYFDEQSLYQQFDLQRSVLDQPNDPQATPIKSLYCPSDDAEGHFFSDPLLSSGKRFSKGNYAAYCSPVHLAWTDWWPSGLSGRHVYSKKNIKDGITKTLLLSEVRTREIEKDQRGVWALPWAGASLLAFDMHSTWPIDSWDDWMSIMQSNSVQYQPWSASFGETQLPNNMGPNVDMLYACPDPVGAQLDGMPCALFNMPYSNTYLSAAPRSRHVGGVNVAFLDGRISFLTDNIDELTMAYLVSSNDGQVVDLSKLQ